MQRRRFAHEQCSADHHRNLHAHFMHFPDAARNRFCLGHINSKARFSGKRLPAEFEKNTFIFYIAHSSPFLNYRY